MEFSEDDRKMLGALHRALGEVVTPDTVPESPAQEPDGDDLPPFVQNVIDQVADGLMDPYLEILLASLHGRKRRLRGTRGF